MSELGNVLSQKPLIREGDTRSIFDAVKEKGTSFEEEFDQAVKNLKYYHIPEEMKLRNILKQKLQAGLQRFIRIFGKK